MTADRATYIAGLRRPLRISDPQTAAEWAAAMVLDTQNDPADAHRFTVSKHGAEAALEVLEGVAASIRISLYGAAFTPMRVDAQPYPMAVVEFPANGWQAVGDGFTQRVSVGRGWVELRCPAGETMLSPADGSAAADQRAWMLAHLRCGGAK